ncbi:MAG: hypothetical protein KatS3mg043_0050 [Rhodothermaceae bacterium]|nr:MAG: hypothetical protein KatS3mg043_0050 [Rhodothermaceae bacterium]
MPPARPHLLGIDDGPFDRRRDATVPLVSVMMEGADLVEGVAVGSFPIDGEGVTTYLAEWIRGQRWRAALQGIVLGGISIAGLALVDVTALARRLDLPVLVVTRRNPAGSTLGTALEAAGLHDRLPLLARTPPARRLAGGLYVAWAGTDEPTAAHLVRASCRKANVPEPLRLAHLIATALVRGASYGRV